MGGSTRIFKVKLLQDFFEGKESKRSKNASNLTVNRSEAMQDLMLLEVTPLCLGTDTVGDMVSTVMKRNARIPTKRTKISTTISDDQQSVWVQVFEGERARMGDNKLLGKFRLSSISTAPRGVPQIGVAFSTCQQWTSRRAMRTASQSLTTRVVNRSRTLNRC